MEICSDAKEKRVLHPRLVQAESGALIALRRYDEAEQLLRQGLENYPNNPFLHYNLGLVFRSHRLRSKSKQEARTALDLLQGLTASQIDERISVTIGGALVLLYRTRDAISYLEHEAARFPDSKNLHATLAGAYASSGHWIKASEEARSLPEEQRHQIRRAALLSELFMIVFYSTVVGLLTVSIFYKSIFFIPLLILLAALLLVTHQIKSGTSPLPTLWRDVRKLPIEVRDNQAEPEPPRSTQLFSNLSLALGLTALALPVAIFIISSAGSIQSTLENVFAVLCIMALITAGSAWYFSARALQTSRATPRSLNRAEAVMGRTCAVIGALGSLFYLCVLVLVRLFQH